MILDALQKLNTAVEKMVSDQPLGSRMKMYESVLDRELSKDSKWIMRLDGNSFSQFTKKIGAEKPFDERLMRIMEAVCISLLEKFNFVTVYSQSDEITCIPNLRPELETTEPIFNLRIQKLCSLVAAHASVVFYQRFVQEFPEFANFTPVFDARIFTVPSEEEVLNAVLWRQRDCMKNAKNLVGQQFYSHKALQGLTSEQQIEKVRQEQGVLFESYPEKFRYGIFVKKNRVEVEGENPLTGEKEKAIRGRPVVSSFPIKFDEVDLDWILSKYGDIDANS